MFSELEYSILEQNASDKHDIHDESLYFIVKLYPCESSLT
jgi:hypothetical protein